MPGLDLIVGVAIARVERRTNPIMTMSSGRREASCSTHRQSFTFESQRLLAEDVLARLEDLHPLSCVKRRRRGQDHGIEPGVLQELGELAIGRLDAEVPACEGALLRHRAAGGDELGTAHPPGEVLGVAPPQPPEAGDAHAHAILVSMTPSMPQVQLGAPRAAVRV